MEDYTSIPMWCGPNDGGIKRGDREETGDLEAQPTETVGSGGSGARTSGGQITADPSSIAPDDEGGATARGETEYLEDGGAGIDDLTVKPADDGSLGLTNVPGHPSEDWAADTGSTKTAEGEPDISGRRKGQRSDAITPRGGR